MKELSAEDLRARKLAGRDAVRCGVTLFASACLGSFLRWTTSVGDDEVVYSGIGFAGALLTLGGISQTIFGRPRIFDRPLGYRFRWFLLLNAALVLVMGFWPSMSGKMFDRLWPRQ